MKLQGLYSSLFFLTSPSTALMIKSSPQHIYSWVYYTWFLFVTDAFPKVLCDALPPTLLAQMAILSFSLSGFVDPRTRTLSHSHTGTHVHTAFSRWIIWALTFSSPLHYESVVFSLCHGSHSKKDSVKWVYSLQTQGVITVCLYLFFVCFFNNFFHPLPHCFSVWFVHVPSCCIHVRPYSTYKCGDGPALCVSL